MDQLAKQMGTITNKYEQIKMFVGFDEDEPEDLTGNIPHMQNKVAQESLMQQQRMLKLELKKQQDNLSTLFEGRIATLE